MRKLAYHVGDLYLGVDKSGAYWYTHGFNWRAFLAWALALWPMLPGFARQVQGVADGNGWDHLYQISYFFGFFVSGFFYRAFSTIFPIERQTGSSPFVLELHAQMREKHGEGRSESQSDSGTPHHEDIMIGDEKGVGVSKSFSRFE